MGLTLDYILDTYSHYNKLMLNFIKSKDDIYFDFLFENIKRFITNNKSKDDVLKEFDALKDMNKSLKNYVINSIFDNLNNNINVQSAIQHINHITINDDDNIDDDITNNNDDGYDTEIYNEELHVGLNSNFFRENQKIAIEKMKEQKFISGINCQIMGAGKSYIILNTIWEHYKMYPFKKIYIILTERIEILRKWFKKPIYNDDGKVIEYKEDKDKFNQWTSNGIINMAQFNFVERFDDKSNIKFNFEEKPTIFVCNNAFMKAQNRYKHIKINKIALILIDECHSVHDRNHQMLMYFKKHGIHIIGFSATPVKSDKKSKDNLKHIYSNNGDDKINLISNYTLIDALKDNIVLPFKHYILNPKYDDNNKNILSKQFLKRIYDVYIDNNSDLPFKKGIGWVGNINCIHENTGKMLNNIKETFENFDILKTYSGKNSVNQIDEFYDKQYNSLLLCVNRCKEGSDIKYLDFCMFLDSVKSRSINVWLQMAGRIMRPDNENVDLRLKKYAVILECLKLDEDKNMTIEIITVDRIMDYYKMILNLSSYEINDKEHIELMNKFKRLYESTYINEATNEIEIDLLENGLNKCIIKFDETIIDWSIFRNFLRNEVNHRIQRIKEDDFNETIDKIKTLDVFSNDVNFWTEYEKLNYVELNILNVNILRNNYIDIWNVKTWYDILGTSNKYLSFSDFKEYISSLKLEYIDENIYFNIYKTNKLLPRFPDEYYKFRGWLNYNDLLLIQHLFF